MTKEKKEPKRDELIDALLESMGLARKRCSEKRADCAAKEASCRESVGRGTDPSSWLRQRRSARRGRQPSQRHESQQIPFHHVPLHGQLRTEYFCRIPVEKNCPAIGIFLGHPSRCGRIAGIL